MKAQEDHFLFPFEAIGFQVISEFLIESTKGITQGQSEMRSSSHIIKTTIYYLLQTFNVLFLDF